MRRAVPWGAGLVGAVLVVAGVVVFAAANRGPADFGWSAYVPLDQNRSSYRSAVTFSDQATVLWTGQPLLGAGLLVLVGVGGRLLGRRSGRRAAARA